MLDAPVSGGEPKAIDGTMSVMVGGKKEIFERYYDMLMSMAGSVVYVGELGSGNVAKLANQMVVAINIAAVAEALSFAKKPVRILSLFIGQSAAVWPDLPLWMPRLL